MLVFLGRTCASNFIVCVFTPVALVHLAYVITIHSGYDRHAQNTTSPFFQKKKTVTANSYSCQQYYSIIISNILNLV